MVRIHPFVVALTGRTFSTSRKGVNLKFNSVCANGVELIIDSYTRRDGLVLNQKMATWFL